MKAIKYMLAAGIGLAAVAAATPASAQYYPGYGYGGGNVIGQVLGQILNPGYGGAYGGYGMNSQAMVNRCAAAVTDRVNRQYGGYAYGGGYGGYNGYNAHGGARVVAITSVERRSNSKVRVRGIAQSAAYGGGGYGYNAAPQEFAFKCNVDYRGYISDIDLDRTNSRYGYNNPYQPYGTYRRY